MKLIPYFERNTPSRELLRAFWGVDEDGSVISWAPRIDLRETKDAYQLRLDLPGVDKKDIEVTLEEGVLTVRGERKADAEEKEEATWHRQERHYGAFQRSLNLGEGVDADKVKAEASNGVLTVTVPKKEAAKPRKIDIH